MTATRRATGALLALGGLLWSGWLLEFLLPTHVSPWSAYVSELGAVGQPYGRLFRAGDLLAGGVLMAAALLGLLAVRGQGSRARVERWVFALLGLFGLATVADSRCPLSCPATSDAACAAREASGAVPWTHLAHAATSSVAGLALGAAFCVLLWRGRHLPWLGRGARLVLGVLLVGYALATSAVVVIPMVGLWVDLLGATQRAGLACGAVLLVVLGGRHWLTAPAARHVSAPARR